MLPINNVTVYIPEVKEFMYMSEGTGDNLNEEDYEAGYIDYVYIETFYYDSDSRSLVERDGGQLMLSIPFDAKYNDYDSLIKDSLDFMYENDELSYVRIETPLYMKDEDIEKEYGKEE